VLYGSSWPWLPGHRYYLAVTNTSSLTQPFSFRMAGTAPDAEESTIVSAPSIGADGTLRFNVSAATNRSYRLQSSTTMAPDSWMDRQTFTQDQSEKVIVLPIDKSRPFEFYRVVSP